MNQLKNQFEIPGIVRIEPGRGGLTKIVVTSPQAAAEIYLHGAHVTHFQPAGKEPVLWMSRSSLFEPNKPIRGGVPICFPWFGPRQGGPKAPAHGFARLREWHVDSVLQNNNGQVVVTLSLKSDGATRALWPADFVLRHIIIVGKTLEMKLELQNLSQQPIHFEEALHTYFSVGDIRRVWVEGLNQGLTYIDKVGGIFTRQQAEPVIRFTGETDRVYLDTQTTCTVNDPAMKRKIQVSKSGSNATVVWNPWIAKSKAMPDFGDDEWTGMLCVETVNAASNAVDLPPGLSHTMSAQIGLL